MLPQLTVEEEQKLRSSAEDLKSIMKSAGGKK
jgi:hypothetical protein